MSDIHSPKGSQQAKPEIEEASKHLEEKRKSLEGKTRILEERARIEKLTVDRKFLVQILQEENHTHDAAIRELEEKIANLDLQIKPAPAMEGQKPSEPAQETPEHVQITPELPQETSNETDALQKSARELLQGSDQSQSEVPSEAQKKKKRSLF